MMAERLEKDGALEVDGGDSSLGVLAFVVAAADAMTVSFIASRRSSFPNGDAFSIFAISPSFVDVFLFP